MIAGAPCSYCNEIARHALEVLQIATLLPECRCALLSSPEPAAGQTAGIAAVLEAAHGQTYLNDGEVRLFSEHGHYILPKFAMLSSSPTLNMLLFVVHYSFC
jgi:hypothetical protein